MDHQLDEDEFYNIYQPYENEEEENIYWDSLVEGPQVPGNQIWTQVETDFSLVLCAGVHYVNALRFVKCRVPFTNPHLEVELMKFQVDEHDEDNEGSEEG